jgi:hypothetical protein
LGKASLLVSGYSDPNQKGRAVKHALSASDLHCFTAT